MDSFQNLLEPNVATPVSLDDGVLMMVMMCMSIILLLLDFEGIILFVTLWSTGAIHVHRKKGNDRAIDFINFGTFQKYAHRYGQPKFMKEFHVLFFFYKPIDSTNGM